MSPGDAAATHSAKVAWVLGPCASTPTVWTTCGIPLQRTQGGLRQTVRELGLRSAYGCAGVFLPSGTAIPAGVSSPAEAVRVSVPTDVQLVMCSLDARTVQLPVQPRRLLVGSTARNCFASIRERRQPDDDDLYDHLPA